MEVDKTALELGRMKWRVVISLVAIFFAVLGLLFVVFMRDFFVIEDGRGWIYLLAIVALAMVMNPVLSVTGRKSFGLEPIPLIRLFHMSFSLYFGYAAVVMAVPACIHLLHSWPDRMNDVAIKKYESARRGCVYRVGPVHMYGGPSHLCVSRRQYEALGGRVDLIGRRSLLGFEMEGFVPSAESEN